MESGGRAETCEERELEMKICRIIFYRDVIKFIMENDTVMNFKPSIRNRIEIIRRLVHP